MIKSAKIKNSIIFEALAAPGDVAAQFQKQKLAFINYLTS
jgi:hypothetical protein